MVPVNGHVEGVLEVHHDHRSAVGVDDGVGLGIAGDQNPTAALRRGHARVRLQQLVAHLAECSKGFVSVCGVLTAQSLRQRERERCAEQSTMPEPTKLY